MAASQALFPSLDNFKYLNHGYVIDVGGNNLRILAVIYFDGQKLFVRHIVTHKEYDKLCDMTTSEDTADNPILHLINLVAASIEKYENSFEEVVEFERDADALDPAIATLRVIMDQNNLAYADLKDEIGSKSLVSQIMNGNRNLTKDHIRKLSDRFHVSPELFF